MMEFAVFYDVFRTGIRLPKSLVLPLHYGVMKLEKDGSAGIGASYH